jgi:hypothetical protein
MAESETFGCAVCCPDEAEAGWEALCSLRIESRLVQESHFSVLVRACEQCTQRFVSVFTETIDWEGGEDPQSWTVLPVRPDEAERLAQASTGLIRELHALAPNRRSWRREHPKGAPASSFWATGVLVGPHD